MEPNTIVSIIITCKGHTIAIADTETGTRQ